MAVSSLLFDGLLLIVLLLFVPIGLWRGGPREALVSGSVLLGALLTQEWTQPWGSALAEATPLREPASRFFVASLILFLTIITIGYGAGAVLRPGAPSLAGRAFGGWLAMFNGAIILAVSLGFVTEFLFENQSVRIIDQSVLARSLRDGLGWVLLGGTALLAGSIVAGISLSAFGGGESRETFGEWEATDSSRVVTTPSRGRPPRVPIVAETSKVEPRVRRFDPETERFDTDRPGVSQGGTVPLTTGWNDRARDSQSVSNGFESGPSVETDTPNGSTLGEIVVRDWLRRGDVPPQVERAEVRDQRQGKADAQLPQYWRDIPKRARDKSGGSPS
jgi:uncharacterized membrane protein required for colicin V production